MVIVISFGFRRLRQTRPKLIRPILVLSIVFVIVLSSLYIFAVFMPTPKVIDLDIRFTYASNSTADTYSSLHHWETSETYSDVYGIHARWQSSHSDVSTNSSGAFADFMYERTQDTYIEWNEIEVLSNNTWTIMLNMILPSIADVSITIRGDNTSITDVVASVTDGRSSSIFQDGLDAFGIQGLVISANISILIRNEEIERWLTRGDLDITIPIDLSRTFQDIMIGTIPDNPHA